MSAEVNLGWNNTRLQAGARGAEAIVRRTTAGIKSTLGSLQLTNIAGVLGGTIGGAGTMLAAGLRELASRGFAFNQTIGDSEIAIANVLRQFQGLNSEAAKNEAAKAMQKMIELEPQTAASLTGLVDGFLATLGPSQAAGISIEKNIDLVGKFANALANANIPAEQISQEMRSILSGNIGADSTLAKVLSISNEDIQRATKAGELYEFLVKKIGTLGNAGDTAAVTYSSLGSAISKAAGELTEGTFSIAIRESKELTETLGENTKAFQLLGQTAALGIESTIAGIKDFAGIADSLMPQSLKDGLKSILPSEDDLKKLEEAKKKAAEIEKVRKLSSVLSSDLTGKDRADAITAIMDPEASARLTPKPQIRDMESMKEVASRLNQIEAERATLAEKQFQTLLSGQEALKQSETILKRIKDLQDQADGLKGPENEVERLKIQGKILDLEKEERAIREGAIAKSEQEKKETERKAIDAAKIATERANELALLDQELAIINAQNAGHDRKAAALQRAKDIAEETLRIMQATGLAQDEAVKKATALVDGRNKGNENRRADGRKRIRGSDYLETGGREGEKRRLAERDEATRKRLQAIQERSFGGLKEYYDMQKDPNRGKVSTPNLDQYKEMQKRGKNAGAPPPAANGQPAATQELPTVEQLLKTLITTTEGLKEG